MGNRADDWLAQAAHDLAHAEHALADGDYDWACFAAHQAAEKAVKGLFLHLGGEGWGHVITRLLRDLAETGKAPVPDEKIRAAMKLDKHYIPTRYPNGFDSGAPKDFYTAEEAEQAISDARSIYQFCLQSLRRS